MYQKGMRFRGGRGRDLGAMRAGGRPYGRARATRTLAMPELKLLLLSLFDERERHGYELIRIIKEKSSGAYAPSPGMVYPALAELADTAKITQTAEEAGRKAFTITEPGKAEVGARGDELAEILARLEKLGEDGVQNKASLRRAMANLELVLEHSASDVAGEKLNRIVDIIDCAAREIERLN